MYLVVIAWLYVVLMMAVAEGTASNGSLLGAVTTFILYGVLPLSIVVYLLGTPHRARARKKAEQEALLTQQATQAVLPAAAADTAAALQSPTTPSDLAPDGSGHAAGAAVAPVRKEA